MDSPSFPLFKTSLTCVVKQEHQLEEPLGEEETASEDSLALDEECDAENGSDADADENEGLSFEDKIDIMKNALGNGADGELIERFLNENHGHVRKAVASYIVEEMELIKKQFGEEFSLPWLPLPHPNGGGEIVSPEKIASTLPLMIMNKAYEELQKKKPQQQLPLAPSSMPLLLPLPILLPPIDPAAEGAFVFHQRDPTLDSNHFPKLLGTLKCSVNFDLMELSEKDREQVYLCRYPSENVHSDVSLRTRLGHEISKLPSQYSQFLGPLIDLGLIVLSFSLSETANNAIHVKLWATKSFFSETQSLDPFIDLSKRIDPRLSHEEKQKLKLERKKRFCTIFMMRKLFPELVTNEDYKTPCIPDTFPSNFGLGSKKNQKNSGIIIDVEGEEVYDVDADEEEEEEDEDEKPVKDEPMDEESELDRERSELDKQIGAKVATESELERMPCIERPPHLLPHISLRKYQQQFLWFSLRREVASKKRFDSFYYKKYLPGIKAWKDEEQKRIQSEEEWKRRQDAAEVQRMASIPSGSYSLSLSKYSLAEDDDEDDDDDDDRPLLPVVSKPPPQRQPHPSRLPPASARPKRKIELINDSDDESDEDILEAVENAFASKKQKMKEEEVITIDDEEEGRAEQSEEIDFSSSSLSLSVGGGGSRSAIQRQIELEASLRTSSLSASAAVGSSSHVPYVNSLPPPDELLHSLIEYSNQKEDDDESEESEDESEDESEEEESHPLFVELKTPNKRDPYIYFQPFTGQCLLKEPDLPAETAGGILADEMGLGKTLQIISLLLANPSPHRRPTLVVAPTSLLDNWKNEILKFCGEKALSVAVWHSDEKKEEKELGSNKLKLLKKMIASGGHDVKSVMDHDVIITSYHMLLPEFNTSVDPLTKKLKGNKQDWSLFYRTRFHRIVLDECHLIKNFCSATAAAVFSLRSSFKWAISGTIVQNSLNDMFSILKFLQNEPYDDLATFSGLIARPFQHFEDQKGIVRLRGTLSPIFLQRTKDMKYGGQPLVEIPARHEQTVLVEFSPEERQLYDFFQRQVQKQVFEEDGNLITTLEHQKEIANHLALNLRLRQACNHMLLVLHLLKKSSEQKSKKPETAEEKQEQKDLEQELMRFFGKKGSAQEFLKEVESFIHGEEEKECIICMEVIPIHEAGKAAVITTCFHYYCMQCIRDVVNKLAKAQTAVCPQCRTEFTIADIRAVPVPEKKEKQKKEEEARSAKVDPTSWRSAAKLRALAKDLLKIKEKGEKAIVFSQFASYLNIIEDALQDNGIQFVRLDGSMNQDERRDAIKSFKIKPRITCFLTTKAGTTGLNLVVANHCFIMEPCFNPTMEDQVIGRIHRIGQTKTCFVTRYLVDHTYEQRMEVIQSNKKAMTKAALSSEHYADAIKWNKMSVEDLQYLYGLCDHGTLPQ